MKSKIVLLSALLFCMGSSDFLYARGHHHHHFHRKHQPHYSHGRVYIARPYPYRPHVQVHRHHAANPYSRTHCHDNMC